MAPLRGRGGSRGRGRGRGRGVARSGIRTRGGFSKTFDSQRTHTVGGDDGRDAAEQAEQAASNSDEEAHVSDEEVDVSDGYDAATPNIRPYNALLLCFQQQSNGDSRPAKKRRLEASNRARTKKERANDSRDIADAEEGDPNVEESGEADGEEEEVANDSHSATGQDHHEDDLSDPFEAHFANPDDNELSKRLRTVQGNQWRTEKASSENVGKLVITAPAVAEGILSPRVDIKDTKSLLLKHRLRSTAEKQLRRFDDLQRAIVPYIFNYQDLLLGSRTPTNTAALRQLACLHALNHVLKGRDKVLKNTARLAAHPDIELELRDQGFTRPKVLILTETRQMCGKYIDSIVSLFEPDQQENKQRFRDAFVSPVDGDDGRMPEDYRELFGGNNHNDFRMSLKLTRKSMKYFSTFYSSDIIFASPLGLRRIIEHEDAKKRDYDFLSSIEIVIVDQADAMQMQKWSNVQLVFEHLNLQPKDAHGCDFGRVRHPYLDGHAKHLRQTIIFSAYITPEMNALFNKTMLNVAGKVKLTPTYAGAITETGLSAVKQTFSRFPSTSPASEPDERFKYFTTAVLPSLLRIPRPAKGGQGILIFIPSYYDFLRIRNHFATSTQTANISFGAIHDYTEVPDQRRARSHFLTGRHTFLLYTQRAHHFYRLKIRGVRRVVMYGLPDNLIFYQELVGGYVGTMISEAKMTEAEAGVRAVFSRWDGLKLERVVGSSRVGGMLNGAGDAFDFV